MNLRIGDTILWRGGFGSTAPQRATVKSIEVCELDEKHGDATDSVPWELINQNPRAVVVDLDNGHWAYGDQLQPVVP